MGFFFERIGKLDSSLIFKARLQLEDVNIPLVHVSIVGFGGEELHRISPCSLKLKHVLQIEYFPKDNEQILISTIQT